MLPKIIKPPVQYNQTGVLLHGNQILKCHAELVSIVVHDNF